MNNEQNIQTMKETLERLRAEKYPHIPPELLDKLLNGLSENIDNSDKASRVVGDILLNYFNSK